MKCNLKEIMDRKGVKPQELVKKTELEESTIYRLRSHKYYSGTSYYTARVICDALGIHMEELYDM